MRALDWFNFFLADIQTGFGPFIAVYLTASGWAQGDIGLILTAGGLVALAGQIPAGALVDASRSIRLLAMFGVAAISASAVAIAGWPIFLVVLGARVVHALASCILGPSVAALSLNLVGHDNFGERLGRNARFASIGAGVAALAMGAAGQAFSSQSVFILTAILVMPALIALARIRPGELRRPVRAAGADAQEQGSVMTLLKSRKLMIFAACIVVFHLANAAMLPLMGGVLTKLRGDTATIWVAACLIVPQLVVAAFSPLAGRKAEDWGRRPLFIICFAALALRGLIFGFTADPALVVVAQSLDGVSAAMLAVLFPLIIADITRETGRFNLALGIVGSAVGIGAALSTTLAGYAFDQWGAASTFFGLAALAATGGGLVLWLMPETGANASEQSSVPAASTCRTPLAAPVNL